MTSWLAYFVLSIMPQFPFFAKLVSNTKRGFYSVILFICNVLYFRIIFIFVSIMTLSNTNNSTGISSQFTKFLFIFYTLSSSETAIYRYTKSIHSRLMAKLHKSFLIRFALTVRIFNQIFIVPSNIFVFVLLNLLFYLLYLH